ncbi:hypothetical protein [Promicromonospora panici]|uniref:hypothetical protein n=1 Tax=Promicromonospora panici TaxID=2219658 RepID=UPI00101BDC78|nr:hypothetical protein [Promicromonospora panici]
MRGRLRGLSKEHAEYVGLHLVMAGRLLDVDPERAYEHTQAAVRGAGRIDIVREAAGLAAYHTNRFAEALRELRTVRRLNGSSEHLPIMADAERGLGRPERALALAASEEAASLDATGRVELAIVASGARSDLGEHDAALAVLDKVAAEDAQGDLGLRVLQARALALEAAGRTDEAAALLASVDSKALERAIGATAPDEDITVFDVEDDAALAEEEYVADHPEEFAKDEADSDNESDDESGSDDESEDSDSEPDDEEEGEDEPADSADSSDSSDSADYADSADSADSPDSADSGDSADSADSADEPEEDDEDDEPEEGDPPSDGQDEPEADAVDEPSDPESDEESAEESDEEPAEKPADEADEPTDDQPDAGEAPTAPEVNGTEDAADTEGDRSDVGQEKE